MTALNLTLTDPNICYALIRAEAESGREMARVVEDLLREPLGCPGMPIEDPTGEQPEPPQPMVIPPTKDKPSGVAAVMELARRWGMGGRR